MSKKERIYSFICNPLDFSRRSCRLWCPLRIRQWWRRCWHEKPRLGDHPSVISSQDRDGSHKNCPSHVYFGKLESLVYFKPWWNFFLTLGTTITAWNVFWLFCTPWYFRFYSWRQGSRGQNDSVMLSTLDPLLFINISSSRISILVCFDGTCHPSMLAASPRLQRNHTIQYLERRSGVDGTRKLNLNREWNFRNLHIHGLNLKIFLLMSLLL